MHGDCPCPTKMMPARSAWSLEPALRNDHDIARSHFYIGRNVATLEQVFEPNAVELPPVGDAEDARGVSIREVGEPSNRDHHIEQRQVFTVSQNLRLCSLADDPDLLA